MKGHNICKALAVLFLILSFGAAAFAQLPLTDDGYTTPGQTIPNGGGP
jgi:hypothetical protein